MVKDKQKIALAALTPQKAAKASFKDLAVAYGILLDKDRLESGEGISGINVWLNIVQSSQSRVVDITPDPSLDGH